MVAVPTSKTPQPQAQAKPAAGAMQPSRPRAQTVPVSCEWRRLERPGKVRAPAAAGIRRGFSHFAVAMCAYLRADREQRAASRRRCRDAIAHRPTPAVAGGVLQNRSGGGRRPAWSGLTIRPERCARLRNACERGRNRGLWRRVERRQRGQRGRTCALCIRAGRIGTGVIVATVVATGMVMAAGGSPRIAQHDREPVIAKGQHVPCRQQGPQTQHGEDERHGVRPSDAAPQVVRSSSHNHRQQFSSKPLRSQYRK